VIIEDKERAMAMRTQTLGRIAAVAVALLAFPALAQDLSIVTDEQKKGGYLVEVTTEALKRVGYTAHVQYKPWPRALHEVMEEGAHDMLLGSYKSRERSEKMLFSDPIGKVEICVFSLKARGISCRSVHDLAPYRVGVIRGFSMLGEFQSMKLNCEAVPTTEQNIAKLLAGRIDVFVDKKATTLFILHGSFPDRVAQVEALSPPLKADFFYNAFPGRRSNARKLLGDFNRGLEMIRSDGSYAAILRRCPHE